MITTPEKILAKWDSTRASRIQRALNHVSEYLDGIDVTRPFVRIKIKQLYIDQSEAQQVVEEFRKAGWQSQIYNASGDTYIEVKFKIGQHNKPWWKIW